MQVGDDVVEAELWWEGEGGMKGGKVGYEKLSTFSARLPLPFFSLSPLHTLAVPATSGSVPSTVTLRPGATSAMVAVVVTAPLAPTAAVTPTRPVL